MPPYADELLLLLELSEELDDDKELEELELNDELEELEELQLDELELRELELELELEESATIISLSRTLL